MVYRTEDFKITKTIREPSLQKTMINGAGVFGNEVYAASASVAMQQVYDRYYAWIRLTKAEYDAFPGNLEAIRALFDDKKRILLTHFSMMGDVNSFDSDLLGPEPLGTKESLKKQPT